MRGYRLTYTVERHDPPLPRDQIPEGHGATDSLVFVSILEDDAGISLRVASRDGNKSVGGEEGQLSPQERFKAWLLWARGLMEDPGLDASRRAMAQAAYELCMSTFRHGPTDPGGN